MSIEAIKQMVKALERLATAQLADGTYADRDCKITFAIAAGRKAIAEAEKQEPVAWLCDWDGHIAAMTQKPEHKNAYRSVTPLYTSPPQRQPLTDEQIEPIAIDVLGFGALLKEDMELFTQTVRAIEAAHGIKGDA